MKNRTPSVTAAGLRARSLAAMILLAGTSTCLAQPGMTDIVDVAAGPLDIPGELIGPRTRPTDKPAPAPPPAAPEDRNWFGGKAWHQWSTLTGDWNGVRTALEDAGITFNASYMLDWSGVWSGGVTRRASTRHLYDMNLKFDLDKILSIPGGTIFADVQFTDSRDVTPFVGSTQGMSVPESGRNIHQLSEFWWEQVWADGLVRTKVGKIDSAAEFATVRAADLFTHSGAAAPRNLVGQPTYPDPSTGGVVFFYPCENLYAGAGIFDGSLAAGVLTGGQGPKPWFHGSENYAACEAGVTWKSVNLPSVRMGSGRIAGGYWYHAGEFTRFDGAPSSHCEGGFVLLEQQLCKRNPDAETDDAGLFAFVHAGFANASVAPIEWSLAGGFTLRGVCPGREHDALGVMCSHAHFSNKPGTTLTGSETAFEVFYNAKVTQSISVRPYIQYVRQPSGSSSAIGNATVGGVRVVIAF